MPLSEHEQKILDEIERRLTEDDPRLAASVKKTSLTTHLLRRIRWALLGFAVGFVLLLAFYVNIWVAVAGFAVMLASALLVYRYLRRMGRDQLRSIDSGGGRFSISAGLARLAERLRRPRGQQ